MLERVWRGDRFRRSRLHDEKGNLVPFREAVFLPVHIMLALARRTTGWGPPVPWLSWPAIRELNRLARNATVIEFGSGLSTIWLAGRAGSLLSIEHDPTWYARLAPMLADGVCVLAEPPAYWQIVDERIDEDTVDVALIDGIERARCVEVILPKMTSGGVVVLDNSDKHMLEPGDTREAERLLIDWAAECRYVTAYPVGNAAPVQTLIAYG